MKIISFAVPCYNSQEYMKKCVESLLIGGNDVEIILVNDGSSDGTAAIADDYANRYPNIVKAIHQKNLGHGGAVNTGLANATGVYFKVVDSDDWLDESSYKQVMEKLTKLLEDGVTVDLMLCNYVYEYMASSSSYTMQYRSTLPQNKVFNWCDVGKFPISQYLLMHSAIYRRTLLIECGLMLPHHTFYVDHIFVYQPLPWVKTLYYMDVDLYRYFIGRADQSVNERIMLQRLDQQVRVNKLMIESHNMNDIKDKRLRTYMQNYLSMVTTATSVFCILSGTPQDLARKEDVWEFLREHDKKLYNSLRHRFFGAVSNLPGKIGRGTTTGLYRIARKIYKFN